MLIRFPLCKRLLLSIKLVPPLQLGAQQFFSKPGFTKRNELNVGVNSFPIHAVLCLL